MLILSLGYRLNDTVKVSLNGVEFLPTEIIVLLLDAPKLFAFVRRIQYINYGRYTSQLQL